MENWGCESLDLESTQPFQRKRHALYLPLWFVKKCVDPEYLANVWAKDREYIDKLARDIEQHGLQDPIEMVIGNNGVVLMNGNHRYCAFELMGRTSIPVKLRSSDRIKRGGISHAELLPLVLEQLYER